MTGSKLFLALVLGTGLVALAAQPAGAAVVRRHIDCFVLAAGVGGLLGGPPQMFATVTNSTSATIPGGTTYSLTVEGRHLTYRSAAPLGPGGNFHVNIGFTSHTGACNATYPDTQFQVHSQTLKQGTLKLPMAPSN
jgi:hypothetical protein